MLGDNEGRYIFVEALVQDAPFLLVNLYAPTKNQEQFVFFDGVANTLEDLGLDHNCQIIDQGLERFPHLGPPISDPPSQAPHFRPRSQSTISSPPPQTPHLRPQARHLRPPTSDPPPQTLHNRPSISDPTLFVQDNKIRPLKCDTPRFSFETTISGPYNLDPTLFVRDYNIRPRQCQTPRFSCETTISGPENVRPHAFRARLQYQAPTMSDPTLFVRDYHIRPRQCQTPRFS